MPKLKTGVSRHVKFSQPGPRGYSQSTILNQPAVARMRESATKLHSDFVQGRLCYLYVL